MFFTRKRSSRTGSERFLGGPSLIGLALIALAVHPIAEDRTTSAEPTAAPAVSVVPAGPVPELAITVPPAPDAVPATTVPATTLPATTVPTGSVSTTTVPATTVPTGSVSTTTVPSELVDVPIEIASVADPFAPIESPDVGDHCAAGLSADDLSAFFGDPIGGFQGADYQRAFKLDDGRVLWTFQDAFVHGTLVHNVGMVQSGRCFTLLNDGARSWLLGDLTSHMNQWHWIFDGGQATDGTVHLFVVQMNETGGSYLTRTIPTTLRRVVLDEATLEVRDVIDEPTTGDDLYGWAVTADESYSYLYSHCYQQFGFDGLLGAGECAVHVKLARVPVGSFDADREYWDGNGWSPDHRDAAAVVDGTFVFSGNNPAQVRFDGERFVLVEKRDDWWGSTVEFGVAAEPQGPFVHVDSVDEPLKCDPSACNTYFAAWLPWLDESGDHIWSIGHNRWNGAETHSHLHIYRPTFHRIDLPTMLPIS